MFILPVCNSMLAPFSISNEADSPNKTLPSFVRLMCPPGNRNFLSDIGPRATATRLASRTCLPTKSRGAPCIQIRRSHTQGHPLRSHPSEENAMTRPIQKCRSRQLHCLHLAATRIEQSYPSRRAGIRCRIGCYLFISFSMPCEPSWENHSKTYSPAGQSWQPISACPASP